MNPKHRTPLALTLLAFAALLPACGGDVADSTDVPTTGSSSTTATATSRAVGAVTVAPTEVRAGDTLQVTCLTVDEAGERHAPDSSVALDISFAPPGAVAKGATGAITAVRAGTVEVRCAMPSLGLADTVGAAVRITPGDAAYVETEVAAARVTAGQANKATCRAYDAYGNYLEGAPTTLGVSPTATGATVEGTTATITLAGLYEFACTSPGAAARPKQVEVMPGLPSQLLVSASPVMAPYPLGSVVEAATVVSDRYGNAVRDAALTFESLPSATRAFGVGRYQYEAAGRYAIKVTVGAPTEGDVPLTGTITFDVASNGPSLHCDSPASGAMVNLAPGGSLTFSGTATDASGVASVTVNGAPATLSGNTFSAPLTAAFGVNTVRIAAKNVFGAENTEVCWFLASGSWLGETASNTDAVTLALAQGAFDDRSRGGATDDFADILAAVINSSALHNQLRSGLIAANPLKSLACDSQTCTSVPCFPDVWNSCGESCFCWYSSGLEYKDSRFPGPNTVRLDLVNGGLAGQVSLNDVGVKVRVHGEVSYVDYDMEGWVNFDYVDVGLTLDTALSGGKPRITVRPGSTSVSVGSVSTDFGGLDGWIVNNIVVPLAQSQIRDAVASQLKSAVSSQLNQTLDSVVSGLGVSTLGTSFAVPRLGGGTLNLSFGAQISTLSVNPTRALFGLSTTLTAPAAHARPSLGVPRIAGNEALLDPTPSSPATTAAGVRLSILNQGLHALWRGGMFDVTLDGASFGSSLGGASVAVTAGLPPVAVAYPATGSTGVELAFGALGLDVTLPGLFGGTDAQGKKLPPLHVGLGGRARAAVTLSGNELRFGTLDLAELAFSTGDVVVTGDARTQLETLLRNLLSTFIGHALNEALPALPIPSFPIPSSLTAYGFPSGQLGLTSPTLSIAPPSFTLRGGFGVR